MSSKMIKRGAYAGVAGGIPFGMMMGMMGMLPMIGMMVGSSSAVAGFGVHIGISAVLGIGFAIVFGRVVSGAIGTIGVGVAYGAAWWVLGPLTLMPLFMGMGLGANWNAHAVVSAMPSLMGHLVFGAVLGLAYSRLFRRQPASVAAIAS